MFPKRNLNHWFLNPCKPVKPLPKPPPMTKKASDRAEPNLEDTTPMNTTTRPYTCGNCPYFNCWPSPGGIQFTDNFGNGGECRKHAPPVSEYCSDKWPKMRLDEWCGEHPFIRVPDANAAC